MLSWKTGKKEREKRDGSKSPRMKASQEREENKNTHLIKAFA